ncbi:MAG: OsmC family protein [Actinomycetota bacterium]
MSTHTATITWRRDAAAPFTDNRYSRAHTWSFDGGAEVLGSSSPDSVPAPLSDPAGVDPEEAFVAALSSCHMLWFLSLAARRRWVVDSYVDTAEGVLGKDGDGKTAITRVTLRPVTCFAGAAPNEEELAALHHQAHERCFIANSVKSEVRCEPRIAG